MNALLIVNADDFGLAAGVNEAVAQAYDRGIVRSASLLAAGQAAEGAAAVARQRPGLGVAVHLALTQVAPLLPASQVPSLAPDGRFFPGPWPLVRRLLAGRIARAEIAAEFAAQVERVRGLGVTVTHLDSHQHLHLLPAVREAFAETARRFRIARLRMPGLGGPSRSAREWAKALAIVAARATAGGVFAGLRHPDRFWGLACSGELTRDRLLAMLRRLGPGTHELMSHPAAPDPSMAACGVWGYHWEAELAALCDPAVRDEIERRGIRLGHFGELAVEAGSPERGGG